jgi:hypothetical protein
MISSSSFLSRFQKYELTIVEKSPAVTILPLAIFLYSHLISPSHFYIFSNLFYRLVLGLHLGLFPPFLCLEFFLDILSSPIRIKCPNHLNLLFWMPFFIYPPIFSNAICAYTFSCYLNSLLSE